MYFPISALLIEYLILTIVDTQDSYGYEIRRSKWWLILKNPRCIRF